jgi:hypothetical protein
MQPARRNVLAILASGLAALSLGGCGETDQGDKAAGKGRVIRVAVSPA